MLAVGVLAVGVLAVGAELGGAPGVCGLVGDPPGGAGVVVAVVVVLVGVSLGAPAAGAARVSPAAVTTARPPVVTAISRASRLLAGVSS
ncbi:MAG: hypothetical protein ACR2JQ_05405 [Mycobacteriales bacterium]